MATKETVNAFLLEPSKPKSQPVQLLAIFTLQVRFFVEGKFLKILLLN